MFKSSNKRTTYPNPFCSLHSEYDLNPVLSLHMNLNPTFWILGELIRTGLKLDFEMNMRIRVFFKNGIQTRNWTQGD